MRFIQVKLTFLYFLIVGLTHLFAGELSYDNLGTQYPITFKGTSLICSDAFELEKKENPDSLKRNNINNGDELRKYLFKSNQLHGILKKSPEFMTSQIVGKTEEAVYFSSMKTCQECVDAIKHKQSLKKWSTLENPGPIDNDWLYDVSGNNAYLLEAKKLQNWLVENFPNRYIKNGWGEKRTLIKGSNECVLVHEYYKQYLPVEEKKIGNIYHFADERSYGYTAGIDMSKIGNIYSNQGMVGGNGSITIEDVLTVDQHRIDDLEKELNNLMEEKDRLEKIESELYKSMTKLKEDYTGSADQNKPISKNEEKWQIKYTQLITTKQNIADREALLDKAQEYRFMGISVQSKGYHTFDDKNVTLLVPGGYNSFLFYVDVLRSYRNLCHEKTASINDQEEVVKSMSKFRPFPKQTELGYEKINITESDISEDDSLMGKIYALLEDKAQEKLKEKLIERLEDELDKSKRHDLLLTINKLEYINGEYEKHNQKYESLKEKSESVIKLYKSLKSATKHMNDAYAASREAAQTYDAEAQLAAWEKRNAAFIGEDGNGGLVNDLSELTAMSADFIYNKIVNDFKLLKLK